MESAWKRISAHRIKQNGGGPKVAEASPGDPPDPPTRRGRRGRERRKREPESPLAAGRRMRETGEADDHPRRCSGKEWDGPPLRPPSS